jgi:Domain of unknown function (DUF3854)
MSTPKARPDRPLHPDHLADLRRSGLTDDTIRTMGVYSVTPTDLSRILGASLAAKVKTVLAFPYPGTDFTRYKLFPPVPDRGGKLRRYFQPKGSKPELYCLPLAQEAIRDPVGAVLITEGEKKAAAAEQAGYACIGLGGVWNWSQNGHLIDALDTIKWSDRPVLWVPDADVWGHDDLLLAVYSFAKELEFKGAQITVAKLPAATKGLDDYFVAFPKGDVTKLPHLTLTKPPLSRLARRWERRRARKEAGPADGAEGRYVVEQGRLCQRRQTRDGVVLDPLANFVAAITEEAVLDDGAETTRTFCLEGRLETGARLPAARVPAARFGGMAWIPEHWGMRAVVGAGITTRDALRAAIQVLSPAARSRHIYTHTGWREIDGRWVYLHATGAIGATDCEVDLGPELARYSLPAEPIDPVGALKASLDLLRSDIAPASLMVPLWASVYRAPTASVLPVDVLIWIEGITGSFKSTLAALYLGHYGPFERITLPGAWSSTANQLERRAFLLKDTCFVIDDWAPSALDARELEYKAERLIRAAGNRAGRGRLRADLTERPAHPPRGLIISTGEQRPSGQGLLARMLVLEADKAEVKMDLLSRAQATAARLPHAMAAYLAWLVPQMPTLPKTLADAFATARQEIMADATHLRVPEAIAHLYLGIDLGLSCAVDLGAASAQEADDLRRFALDTLKALSAKQGALIASEKPTHRFLRVLATLLAQGRAALLPREGGSEAVMGKAEMLGWQDADALYLLPEAAWHAVVRFCRETGEPFPIREERFRRDLEREGLAEGQEGRRTANLRIAGKQRRVLQIRRAAAEKVIGEAFPADPPGATGPAPGPFWEREA